MSSEKGSGPPWHPGLHLLGCCSHSKCCNGCPHHHHHPCPSSPHLPQELPLDRRLALPAGAQPSSLESPKKSPWKKETSVKAPALLFAVARARTCPLRDWGMKVAHQLLYFYLESGRSSGAIMICAVAAHTREQPCG